MRARTIVVAIKNPIKPKQQIAAIGNARVALVAGATVCTGCAYIESTDFHLVHQYNEKSIVCTINRMY